MPATDPYATAAEYRARVDSTVDTEDTEITAQLKAISRLIDRKTRRKDGFRPTDADEERVYHGNGKAKLWIPDDIVSVASLNIDDDGDGTADVALAENTDYWLGPANADKGPEPEPFAYLEVHPNSALLGEWPDGRRTVAITGKYGWPAVPDAIREATVGICRHLRDLQEAGFALTVNNIDAAIRQSPEASIILEEIMARYSRGAHYGDKS